MPGRPQTADKARKRRNLLRKDMVEISASCVRTAGPFGYLRLCKRPHWQAVLPCLAGFLNGLQSVDLVNTLRASRYVREALSHVLYSSA